MVWLFLLHDREDQGGGLFTLFRVAPKLNDLGMGGSIFLGLHGGQKLSSFLLGEIEKFPAGQRAICSFPGTFSTELSTISRILGMRFVRRIYSRMVSWLFYTSFATLSRFV